MCGIVGYTGYQNAGSIVLDGLKTLEYRGYDSAGIALETDDGIFVAKCGGRVRELEGKVPFISARTGIGHTRWATHGEPSEKNAHPHLSPDRRIAVVHNGIIENCGELKASPELKNAEFISDTDSEIIAHLLSLSDWSDCVAAIDGVAERLIGSSSFIVMRENDENLYCRRMGASLSIGISENQNFVASDTLAITKYTNKIIVLEDGETAVISPDKVRVFKMGEEIFKQPLTIERSIPSECKCFMRTEINDIPYALLRTYESYLRGISDALSNRLASSEKIYVTGCGTAYHAALYGKGAIEALAGVPCEAMIASEFTSARFLNERDFVIFISQSGETADTLAALHFAKARGAATLAITNVKGSTISFDADYTLLLDAGAEIAVAATKSFNCQLLTLYLLANGAAGRSVPYELIKDLADKAEDMTLADLYRPGYERANMFFVGRGADAIIAREGALKLKEITYKMTDAYPLGELKHGAIALIDRSSVVICVATEAEEKAKAALGISELRSRGALTAAVSSVGDVGADKTLTVPALSDPLLYPILSVIPLQNLALSAAEALDLNPDKPRNLAKSVTVI